MNRKTLIILGCCFLFASALVITLYAATYKIVHKRSSLLRIYKKGAAIKATEMDIKFNSWYIAGITENQIYLGNVTTPFRLMVVNNTLTDSQQVKLSIEKIKNVSKSTTVKIAYPYFYLADGKKPALYRGKIGEWHAKPIDYDSEAYFTKNVPIGKESFGIRTNVGKTLDNVLGKVQRNMPRIYLNPKLLEKQIDGLFCTDGVLLYNNNLNQLIYTYYYRNEYTVCDTNLNLLYRGHTIDTFSQARIKVGKISSENRKILLSKEFVNTNSCTSGEYLFIKSNVLAKTDKEDKLSHDSIIDVYDLKHNRYHFSFTIPHFNFDKKIRMKDFMVFDTKILVAIHDHHIVRYDLRSLLFNNQNKEAKIH